MFWPAVRSAWKASFSTVARHRLTVRLSQALAMSTSCPPPGLCWLGCPCRHLLRPPGICCSWTAPSPHLAGPLGHCRPPALPRRGCCCGERCSHPHATRASRQGPGPPARVSSWDFSEVPGGAKNVDGVVTSAGAPAAASAAVGKGQPCPPPGSVPGALTGAGCAAVPGSMMRVRCESAGPITRVRCVDVSPGGSPGGCPGGSVWGGGSGGDSAAAPSSSRPVPHLAATLRRRAACSAVSSLPW